MRKVPTKMTSLHVRVGQRWEVGPSMASGKVSNMQTVAPMQVASDNNVRYARAGIKLAQCSKYVNTQMPELGSS